MRGMEKQLDFYPMMKYNKTRRDLAADVIIKIF